MIDRCSIVESSTKETIESGEDGIAPIRPENFKGRKPNKHDTKRVDKGIIQIRTFNTTRLRRGYKQSIYRPRGYTSWGYMKRGYVLMTVN